jgi:hypothetical protein
MSSKRRTFRRAIAASCLGFTLTIALEARGETDPDFREGARILAPRENPYGLSIEELEAAKRAGKLHALEYPVEITGALLPWRPLRAFLNDPSPSPIRSLLQSAFEGLSRIRTTDDFFARIGLHSYPKSVEEGSDSIPRRGPEFPAVRMGATLLSYRDAEALTISCAACHSGSLFGKKILGLSNRFPRANEIFVLGKAATSLVGPKLFAHGMAATEAEADLYDRLRTRMRAVGSKVPTTLGLDTSLAQVALSLARRADDREASFDPKRERSPRPDPLAHSVADSKPAVWWNIKYKNRWLSDGAIVSGNPIDTSFLWNELGRGTDLRELERWFEMNEKIVRELAAAVFSSEAPRMTDFFPPERIDFERARKGQQHFIQACARCHGTYAKAWDLPESKRLPLADRLRTLEVRYPETTKVIDVGTDPLRYLGMRSVAQGLNPLAISEKRGILIKPQKGYVPPPLVGIWARYPYFHNNSAPTLCAVLSAAETRPVVYWAGEALDRERDFDPDCVGYPSGSRVPPRWKKDAQYFFDTRKTGLSNRGHDTGIFIKDGREIFTAAEKRELIEFLKTL